MNKTNTIHTDQVYFRSWQKKGNSYMDEEVAALPFIHASHPQYSEWTIRKHSLRALLNYIKNKKTFTHILQVGCGNGWLSSRIAKAVDAEVTGIDINSHELNQAKRVFKNILNLNFINGRLEDDSLKNEKFDMILFEASAEYFPSLKQIMQIALEHITLQGEVHIMDSPFYQQHETSIARQHHEQQSLDHMKTQRYYHTLADLENFQFKILHHPNSWKNKLSIKKNPFYWITIKNRYQ
jgi:protein-L-isoaspartate O-methyltransferase